MTKVQGRRVVVSQLKTRRGSAMVESVLVLLVLFTVLIGIADMGQFLFLRSSVVERMRAALRFGVITYDPTAIQNIVLYGTATPQANAQASFNLTASMVQVTRLDANTSADRVTITITNYPLVFYSPFLAGRLIGPPLIATQQTENGTLPWPKPENRINLITPAGKVFLQS